MIGRGQFLGIVLAATTALAVSSAVVVFGRAGGTGEPPHLDAALASDSTGELHGEGSPQVGVDEGTSTPSADTTKVPPDDALSPDDVAELPTPVGTIVSPVEEPVNWGRFTVLPVGSVPGGAWLIWYPVGRTQVSVDLHEASSVAECSQFALYMPLAGLPEGYQLEGCSEQIVTWDDGSTSTSNYFANYWVAGRFPITIGRARLRAGVQWGLVDENPPVVLSLTEAGGTEVVMRHHQAGTAFQGPFSVYFADGDVVTELEGAGLDPRDLLSLANQAIEALGAPR